MASQTYADRRKLGKGGRGEGGLRKRVALQENKSHKVADSEVETYPAGGQSGTTGGCFAGSFFVNFVVKMLSLSFDSFFFLMENELNYSQSEAPIWTNTGVATHVAEQLK